MYSTESRRTTKWATALLLGGTFLVTTACGSSNPKAGRVGAGATPETKRAFEAAPQQIKDHAAAATKTHATTVSYVGKVAGSEAYIGIVDTGGEFIAYVCDGAKVAEWLDGQVSGTSLTAKSAKVSLTATRSGSTVSGTVTLAGSDQAFSAKSSTDFPSDLWEATGVKNGEFVRGGWIVLPDGSQHGAVKQAATITSTASLDTTTAAPDVDGSGALNPATPAAPVPAKKKITLTIAQQCANLAFSFAYMTDQAINTTGATSDASIAAANRAYTQASNMGCSWAADL